MTLLNPAGLIFGALAPLIILLYLLKLRRQPAQVSTLMFWHRVVADSRRRALFQRLRQILSLLLQLLIFGLLLLALARPELRAFRGTEEGLQTIVVLDCRARMQTMLSENGGGRTRFSEAAQIAEGYLRRASNRQPVALLAADSAPRVVCGSTGDERALLDALASLHPSDAGGRLEDAIQLAQDMLGAEHNGAGSGRIVVVTDRTPSLAAPAAAAGKTLAGVPVETRVVNTGGRRENVGLVRLSARPLPGNPSTDEVLLEIQNFGARRQAGSIEITFEGRLLDVKPFDLAPGEKRTDIYPALASQTGIANARGWLSAHLTLADRPGGAASGNNNNADALPLDDTAYAVVPPLRPIHVLLVTRGNLFLESLLKSDDAIQFDQLAPEAFQPSQAAAFEVVVFDDWTPPAFTGPSAEFPRGAYLLIGRAPFPVPAAAVALEHPLITDTDPASPLLRQVNLRDVTILRAQAWPLPDAVGTGLPASGSSTGTTTAEANTWRFDAPVRSLDHALVLAGERRPPAGTGTSAEARPSRPDRLVALAFGTADSDLPLRIAFPLFIHNAATWLAAREDSTTAAEPVRAGETIDVPARATLWTVAQRTYEPLGQIPPAEIMRGPATFQASANGFYLLSRDDGSQTWIAVNTADSQMSDVNAAAPQPESPQPSKAAPMPTQPARNWQGLLESWPPWIELALIAFVLCSLEWWGFHRRRTE